MTSAPELVDIAAIPHTDWHHLSVQCGGNAHSTAVFYDGKPVNNVSHIRYDIDAMTGRATAILTVDLPPGTITIHGFGFTT